MEWSLWSRLRPLMLLFQEPQMNTALAHLSKPDRNNTDYPHHGPLRNLCQKMAKEHCESYRDRDCKGVAQRAETGQNVSHLL